jgi:hypothetical protein
MPEPTDTLYFSDFMPEDFAPCEVCNNWYPIFELKEIDMDAVGNRVLVCDGDYDALLNG